MLCASLFSISALFLLFSASSATAGPKEDVAAMTQAWIDAMNSHDTERVVALYDPDAVLWGTVSPTIRDTPAAIRDYFKGLPNMPPEFKGVLGEQRVRVYGDIAVNSGTYYVHECPRWQANYHLRTVQFCLPQS
jgi:uncharacterized protein (TIGR02246 family)